MEHSVYMIDYENTSYKGLYGIGSIQANDEIIIFYSNSIAIIKDILNPYKKIKYFKLEDSGKNALDFMITTYIGYYASKKSVGRIAVISNDKGYTSIKPVIDDINKNIEICFECCIHNVIYPEKKTKIISVSNVEEEKKDNSKQQNIKPQISDEVDFVNLSADNKKKYVRDIITKEKKIKDSYISSVASHIVKYIDDKNMFIQKVSKQLGTSSENVKYRKEAENYFDRIKKLWRK